MTRTRNLKFFGILALFTSTFAALHPTFRTNLVNSPTRRLMAARLAAESPDMNAVRRLAHPLHALPATQPAFSSLEAPVQQGSIAPAVAAAQDFRNAVNRTRDILARHKEAACNEIRSSFLGLPQQTLCQTFMAACRAGDTRSVQFFLDHPHLSDAINHARGLYGGNALHAACDKGRTSVVRLLLAHQPWATTAINERDELGKTPLYAACYRQHNALARLLLEQDFLTEETIGAQTYHDRNTVLHILCNEGNAELLRHVINRIQSHEHYRIRATSSRLNPFQLACARGHAEIVQMLLDHPDCPADAINARNFQCETALSLAAYNRHLPVVRILLANSRKFDEATISNHRPEILQRWNRCYWSCSCPLTTAVTRGNMNVLLTFLEDPRIGTYLNGCDPSGRNVLQLACQQGLPVVAQAILDHPSFTPESAQAASWGNNTALHYACSNLHCFSEDYTNRPATVAFLLAHPGLCRKMLSTHNADGYLPLHALLAAAQRDGQGIEVYAEEVTHLCNLLLGNDLKAVKAHAARDRAHPFLSTDAGEDPEAECDELANDEENEDGRPRRRRIRASERREYEREEADNEDDTSTTRYRSSFEEEEEEDSSAGEAEMPQIHAHERDAITSILKQGFFFADPNARVRRGAAGYDPAAGARGR